uniref:Peptidase S72 domain-containing protein n=1 Tax=Hucho hucho TaxID=62062 RepID=A0A4W5JYC1_9TELE
MKVHPLLQVSLANDDAIPRWLAVTEKTGKLFGLALREDCGQYPLKVSVAGHCVSITYFHLHVLNGTVGEGSLFSTHINLDADQRVQLTSTMADYLRMTPGSVHLLSLRSRTALQREKTRVCRQDPLTAEATRGKGEGTLGRGQAAELLWPVGCGVGEQLSNLARILEHSTASGRLTTTLGVPILGWRVLCKELLPRIRRGLQPLRHTATPTAVLPPPTQVPESVRLELSHIPALEPSTSLMMSYPTAILETHTGTPNLELTQASSYPLTSSVACEGVLQSPPSVTRDNLLSMPLKPSLLTPECFTQSLKRPTFHTATKTEMVPTVSMSRESNHSQLILTSSTKCFPTQQTCTFPFRESGHISMDTHTHSVTTFATVGFPFHYTIPSRTFLDPEDGAAESLSLELMFIDGHPVTLGSWVALDGLELHGVPLEVDLQFAPQQLLLAAQDNQGLAAWLPITLDLHRSHAEPCHSFSLTAHRSLYSLLSQRHRVELLLDKLSRFFNDSGSHHLAVLSLAPGSTIVSWYNFTLCQVGGDGVEGRCPVGRVWRMWEEISSEARQNSPAFSQAMLPEFPISKVGPVSFRRDCFSSPTTATATASTSDPTGASVRQTDPYHWMASVLTALLVVCCLFLAVALTFTVIYFCRSRVRVRTLAIWPSEGVVPGHTMDLRAIRPRMPPLFQPEIPPPPPRLWLNASPASGEHLSPTYPQGRQPYQRAVSIHPPPPQYPHNRSWEHKSQEEKHTNK